MSWFNYTSRRNIFYISCSSHLNQELAGCCFFGRSKTELLVQHFQMAALGYFWLLVWSFMFCTNLCEVFVLFESSQEESSRRGWFSRNLAWLAYYKMQWIDKSTECTSSSYDISFAKFYIAFHHRMIDSNRRQHYIMQKIFCIEKGDNYYYYYLFFS